MLFKSSSLNLWDIETKQTKLDIDAHDDRIDLVTTGSQPLKVHPTLHLVHSAGDIVDLASKIKLIEADITSNSSVASSGILAVSNSLDAYKLANDSSVGTLQASLATETAQRQQGQTDDASARASDKSAVEALITSEVSRATSAEGAVSAALSAETSRATSAETAIQTSLSTVNTNLTAAIAVERQRIDSVLSDSSLSLDTLKEITDAYANVDSNVLNQIADMSLTINQLVSRVNSLVSSNDDEFVVALSTAISELDLVDGSAYLQQPFSINYDMRDLWSSTNSSYLGWDTYKAVLIASSGGILSGSSTDSEVETYLKNSLDAVFGANVLEGSTLADYRLKYADNQHYLLETGLENSHPYFKGIEQTGLSTCSWRLSYTTVANDPSKVIYSTILSGNSSGKNLMISPSQTEFPVNGGVSGLRDGYRTLYSQLTLK